MPAKPIRQRLIPYRLLGYLLYGRPRALEWLESVSSDEVRVTTGPAARELRIKNIALWNALFWLKEHNLIVSVSKERKRGTALIKLKQPLNINLPAMEKNDE